MPTVHQPRMGSRFTNVKYFAKFLQDILQCKIFYIRKNPTKHNFKVLRFYTTCKILHKILQSFFTSFLPYGCLCFMTLTLGCWLRILLKRRWNRKTKICQKLNCTKSVKTQIWQICINLSKDRFDIFVWQILF